MPNIKLERCGPNGYKNAEEIHARVPSLFILFGVHACIGVFKACVQTVDLSETCRVLLSNKFEKLCSSFAFILRIYHDARSSECQIQHTIYSLVGY